MEWVRLESRAGSPVWVYPMPHANTVAVGVHVNIGTREEEWPREAGIAHALEHMLFQGTRRFPTQKDLTWHIEAVGGVINAWTSREMTFYFNCVAAAEAKRSFEVLSEQVLCSTLSSENVKTEVLNVVEEIKRKEDNPQALSMSMLNRAMYGTHPLSREVLGTRESVLAFTPEMFRVFMGRGYRSRNLTHIVVGRIAPDAALRYIDELFLGDVDRSEVGLIRKPHAITGAQKDVVVVKDIQQANVGIGATFGRADLRSSLCIDLFSEMIGAGMSFPLFQEVRTKRGLCYAVSSDVKRWSDIGSFQVYIGTDLARADEAIKVVYEVIQHSKHDGVLLSNAQRLLRGGVAFQYESPVGILNIAAYDVSSDGMPKTPAQRIGEIESIGIDEIASAVDMYLGPGRFTTVRLQPSG